MRLQWVVYLATAMFAGAAGSALWAAASVGAVAREIVESQQGVHQLSQGQKDIRTAIAQERVVEKTLIELPLDSLSKLSGTVGIVQKSVQEIQANSGARPRGRRTRKIWLALLVPLAFVWYYLEIYRPRLLLRNRKKL